MSGKSKLDREPTVDADTRRILESVASALHDFAYRSKPLERWQAAAFAAQMSRIAAGDTQLAPTEAQLRERSAALSYVIRRELSELSGKKGQGSKIRGDVAALYGYSTQKASGRRGPSDTIVTKLASTHRRFVTAWLERMGSNIEYRGLDRPQMLERELKSIEENLPTPTKKR